MSLLSKRVFLNATNKLNHKLIKTGGWLGSATQGSSIFIQNNYFGGYNCSGGIFGYSGFGWNNFGCGCGCNNFGNLFMGGLGMGIANGLMGMIGTGLNWLGGCCGFNGGMFGGGNLFGMGTNMSGISDNYMQTWTKSYQRTHITTEVEPEIKDEIKDEKKDDVIVPNTKHIDGDDIIKKALTKNGIEIDEKSKIYTEALKHWNVMQQDAKAQNSKYLNSDLAELRMNNYIRGYILHEKEQQALNGENVEYENPCAKATTQEELYYKYTQLGIASVEFYDRDGNGSIDCYEKFFQALIDNGYAEKDALTLVEQYKNLGYSASKIPEGESNEDVIFIECLNYINTIDRQNGETPDGQIDGAEEGSRLFATAQSCDKKNNITVEEFKKGYYSIKYSNDSKKSILADLDYNQIAKIMSERNCKEAEAREIYLADNETLENNKTLATNISNYKSKFMETYDVIYEWVGQCYDSFKNFSQKEQIKRANELF